VRVNLVGLKEKDFGEAECAFLSRRINAGLQNLPAGVFRQVREQLLLT
jgi:hypothetical protein